MPDVVEAQAPTEAGAAASPALRFTIGSRTQRRFANTQTVSNLAGATSFQPIQLPATGFNRKVSLFFNQLVTSASAGAVVAGDGPWNLIANITITDATGQAIFQPVTGYNLYLINKYLAVGSRIRVRVHGNHRHRRVPPGPRFRAGLQFRLRFHS
jgi:hypothetical protein